MKRVQRGRPREGQIQERGVVEVKAADVAAGVAAESARFAPSREGNEFR